MDLAIGLSVLAILVLANGLATRVVVRDPDTERHRKLFQLLAVWLVPVFGAIFIFAIHREPEKATGKYREARDNLDLPAGEANSRLVGRAIHPQGDD